MVRVPPNRVMNSAGEATVKSLWRSIFRCSRPFFTRWRPDMLGLTMAQCSVTQTGQLLSPLCITSRVNWYITAYFLQKRHSPATATDRGGSLQPSVAIRTRNWSKKTLHIHWRQGERNCCHKSNQSQSSVSFLRRQEQPADQPSNSRFYLQHFIKILLKVKLLHTSHCVLKFTST